MIFKFEILCWHSCAKVWLRSISDKEEKETKKEGVSGYMNGMVTWLFPLIFIGNIILKMNILNPMIILLDKGG